MKKIYKMCIVFCLMIVAAVFYTICANAAPIDGMSQVLTQPDGTDITVYFYGDEVFNYMTDESGYILIQNENGYYVYASLNSDNDIQSTDFAYGISSGGQGGGGTRSFVTSDDIPQNMINEAYKNSRFYKNSSDVALMSSLDYTDKSLNNMEINNIVVFISFNDTDFSTKTYSYYDNLFNNASTSAKNYYNEMTYGKLNVTSSFYPKTTTSTILTYKDPYNASYYSASNYNYSWENQQDREQAMFKRAIEYVKNQIPDDLELDRNSDGYVDMITFVLPGEIVSGSNQVRWPHQWWFAPDYTTTINGLSTDQYNVQIEGSINGQSSSDGSWTFQNGSAIICHETLHILGFPDMYYYNYSYPTNKNSLREWDIMCQSNGAHTSAYMKCVYGGWLDIPEIKTNGTYTLNSLADGGTCAYKIRSPYSANEYFIVEYRRSAGNFEKNVPNTGLVIYRVLASNYTCGNGYASASDGTDDELRYLNYKRTGSYAPTLSNGKTAGISLTSISATDTTATFALTITDNKHLKYFRDENLANAIISKLGKSESEITDSDLQSITNLSVYGGYYEQSYDLCGIEHLTGLTSLSLSNCGIDDISCLQSLTNLTSLNLTDNNIADISPLSSLTKLKTLYLRGNCIEDYSTVAGYYANLITKDFSLEDNNDAVFWVPNIDNGVINSAYIRLSSTRPAHTYYSIEKYDSTTGELIKRYRSSISTSSYYTQRAVSIPSEFYDDENTYIKLKTYESGAYRKMMNETIVDGDYINLSSLAN